MKIKIGAPDNLQSTVALVIIIIPWLKGIGLATGFWGTLAAITFAPYAWYLTINWIWQ